MSLVQELCLRSFVPFKLFLKRTLTSVSASVSSDHHYFQQEYMNAWTVPSFGSLEHILLSDKEPVPTINHHRDVLVKIHATSINSLDLAMVGGYGNTLLNVIRQCDDFIHKEESSVTHPFIPGRDFAGQIIAKGSGVQRNIKVGDIVYGVVPPHLQGCHAEMVITNDTLVGFHVPIVKPVPEGISITDAASYLYCGLTGWSALCITGDLFWSNRKGKRVLIIGGAGGVGSLAVQMLKAWNVEVVATCRTDAIPLVENLGADIVIDYTAADAMKNIEESGKYDIILDAAGNVTHYTYIPFLKDWSNSKYITLRSPLLANTDKFGIVAGMLKNASELVRSNIVSGALSRGSTLRWGYFLPIESGIDELHNLLTEKKVRPIVNKVLPFNELPKSYQMLKEGHNRGKIVLSM